MRRAKKETTELIHLIENTWSETQKGRNIKTAKQAETIAAIAGTLYFLEMLDEVKGENHKTYFIKKHLSLHNNMSQTRLSNEYCICRDSVSNYCAMYLKVFEGYLKTVKGMSGMLDEQSPVIKNILADISRAAVQNRNK